MQLPTKKISLLFIILVTPYLPIGCTSCGLTTPESERYIIEHFELHAANLDTNVQEVTKYTGWQENSLLSPDHHGFILIIDKTKRKRRGLFNHIYNPLVSIAYACEHTPFSNQIIHDITITSDKAISADGILYEAGVKLNEIFAVDNIFYLTGQESLQEITERPNIFGDPNYFALIFRFSEQKNIDFEDIIDQQFYFQIVLDDGKIFNSESQTVTFSHETAG